MPRNKKYNSMIGTGSETRERNTANPEPLEFVPLYFGNKLKIINPRGRVGIVTLWSTQDFVISKLKECGIDLHPQTSKVAVVGNLYGNGLPHLLRNLLYNPQIRDLAIFGADRSGSATTLAAFFERGIKKAEHLGEDIWSIAGTNHIIDPLVTPDMFEEKPRFHFFGEPTDKESAKKLYMFIQDFNPSPPVTCTRIEVPLPEVRVTRFPSEARSHVIVKKTPLEAWRELVFRLVRFGHLVHLQKGERQELQNVKVVITNPRPDDPEELIKYNFSLEELVQYQYEMLSPELTPDQSYTYGNRLLGYFGMNALAIFADRLRKNPQDRHCYFTLWDNKTDISAESSPCLVSIFFRVFEKKLTLTAVYRTHNVLDAWLKNVYGLMKVQDTISQQVGIDSGPLTVISHSISIDPSRYDFAKHIAETKSFAVELDPNGYFIVSVDHEMGEIVACHMSHEGTLLKEYRGRKAERIQHEIARDCAISDINHALYVGRQLALAEECLKTGRAFEEET